MPVRGRIESREADAFYEKPSFGENKTFVSSDDDCEDSRIERMDDTKNWEPAV